MQLGLFAAPRNEGIWDEVRAEIAESLTQQRGKPTERSAARSAPNCPPRSATAPAAAAGALHRRRRPALVPAGDARRRRPPIPAKAEVFEEALRQVIVVRGTDPLPVRDPVPLTLPKDVVTPATRTRPTTPEDAADDPR